VTFDQIAGAKCVVACGVPFDDAPEWLAIFAVDVFSCVSVSVHVQFSSSVQLLAQCQ
jgi:hypothetical protein